MKELFLSADVTGVVTWIGTLVSLWGLYLSWRVYSNVTAIKKDFIFSARLPGLIAGFKEIKQELLKEMGDVDIHNSNGLTIAEVCIAKLDSLRVKLDSNLAKQLKPKIDKINFCIEKYKGNRDASNLQHWYVSVVGLITSLEELIADRNWEKVIRDE